jgi:hypothetical protein
MLAEEAAADQHFLHLLQAALVALAEAAPELQIVQMQLLEL